MTVDTINKSVEQIQDTLNDITPDQALHKGKSVRFSQSDDGTITYEEVTRADYAAGTVEFMGTTHWTVKDDQMTNKGLLIRCKEDILSEYGHTMSTHEPTEHDIDDFAVRSIVITEHQQDKSIGEIIRDMMKTTLEKGHSITITRNHAVELAKELK